MEKVGWLEISKSLVVSCFNVLRSDKKLLIFPIFSSLGTFFIASGLYIIAFLILRTGSVEFTNRFFWIDFFRFYSDKNELSIVFWVVYFFLLVFIAIYLKSALILYTYSLVQKRKIGFSESFWQAAKNIRNLLVWTLISTTIGVLLKALARKKFGEQIRLLLGIGLLLGAVAWGILTYFVIPIMVIQRVGPLVAIKRSASLMKKTWGENLLSHIRIAVFFLPFFFLFLVLAAFITPGASGTTIATVLLIALFAIWCISIFQTTIYTILKVVLFVYVSTGKVPRGFQEYSLKNAFTSRTDESSR